MTKKKKDPPLYARLLTAAQAAFYFSVGEGWIYTMCQLRELSHIRIGSGKGMLRFDIRELRNIIKRKRVREALPVHLLPDYLQPRLAGLQPREDERAY